MNKRAVGDTTAPRVRSQPLSDLDAARAWLARAGRLHGQDRGDRLLQGGDYALHARARRRRSRSPASTTAALTKESESFLPDVCPIVGSYGGRDRWPGMRETFRTSRADARRQRGSTTTSSSIPRRARLPQRPRPRGAAALGQGGSRSAPRRISRAVGPDARRRIVDFFDASPQVLTPHTCGICRERVASRRLGRSGLRGGTYRVRPQLRRARARSALPSLRTGAARRWSTCGAAAARPPATEPWNEDTLVVVNSTTKGLAAMTVAVANSRGWIDYDAPVAEYWPEFAQNGKGAVTVRQLLSHEAGLVWIDEPLRPRGHARPRPGLSRARASEAGLGAGNAARLPRDDDRALHAGADPPRRPRTPHARPVLRRGDREAAGDRVLHRTAAGDSRRAARAAEALHSRCAPSERCLRSPRGT